MWEKAIIFVSGVSLLGITFWVGRASVNTGDAKSHGESAMSQIVKSASELVPHGHEEEKGNADDHQKSAAGKLTLSSDEKSSIGLKNESVDFRRIDVVIRAAGMVKAHPNKEAQVSSRVAGKITGLFAQVGDAVKAGQRIVEIQSPEIQKLQVELIQAENKLVLHGAELERIRKLVDAKIAAQKELIAAQNQHQSTLNEIEGLAQQLVLLGLPEEAVKRLRTQKTVSTFSIFSPLGGLVAERNVVLGETVDSGKVILKVIDPSVVSVEGDVFEEALPRLKTGQTVRIRLASYPGEVFTGKILRFSPVIDPQKRTLHLWVEVANPAGKLKPNLFAEMDIVVGGAQEVLAVPLEALITAEGSNFVFVEDKGTFRRADVTVGARDDRYVEVKRGLVPGDLVVTTGKQQVYTKSLIAQSGGAALGGHGH